MPADHEAELDAGIDDARIYAEQAINSLGQAITNYPGEPMLSSARVCLADAIKLHARGDHELARHRADHGLRYLVGFSADELRPPTDAGEPLDEQRRRLPDTPELAAALVAVDSITDTHSQLALVLVELERVNAELEATRLELNRARVDINRQLELKRKLQVELERCQLGNYPPPVQSTTTQEDH